MQTQSFKVVIHIIVTAIIIKTYLLYHAYNFSIVSVWLKKKCLTGCRELLLQNNRDHFFYCFYYDIEILNVLL